MWSTPNPEKKVLALLAVATMLDEDDHPEVMALCDAVGLTKRETKLAQIQLPLLNLVSLVNLGRHENLVSPVNPLNPENLVLKVKEVKVRVSVDDLAVEVVAGGVVAEVAVVVVEVVVVLQVKADPQSMPKLKMLNLLTLLLLLKVFLKVDEGVEVSEDAVPIVDVVVVALLLLV